MDSFKFGVIRLVEEDTEDTDDDDDDFLKGEEYEQRYWPEWDLLLLSITKEFPTSTMDLSKENFNNSNQEPPFNFSHLKVSKITKTMSIFKSQSSNVTCQMSMTGE